MVAEILEKIGDGVEQVVAPVHDALDPEDTTAGSKAYYLGGTVVLLVALFFIFKKKLLPTKIRYRYRKARTAMRTYRKRK